MTERDDPAGTEPRTSPSPAPTGPPAQTRRGLRGLGALGSGLGLGAGRRVPRSRTGDGDDVAARRPTSGNRPPTARGPEPGSPATVPARRALGLVLAVLGLLAVLRAPAMVHAGQGMRPGTTRDLVLTVARPMARVSEATRLDEPDRLLSKAFGHDVDHENAASELAAAAAGVAGTEPAPNRGPHPTGPAATPPPTLAPLRSPTPADPLRVLVTGDSLTESLGPTIMNTAPPTIRAQTDTRFGTGLVRPDFFDWATHARAQIAEQNPELVIVAMGGNDGQGITMADGTILPAGSDEWAAEYQRRATVVMRIWSGDGARRVVWLSLPPARSDRLEGYFRRLNEATSAAAGQVLGARYLDLTGWLSKNGAYSDYLTDASGRTVLARARDGVHLSLDGARIAAGHVLDAVRTEWNLS